MSETAVLLVGTTKGLFLLHAPEDWAAHGAKWDVTGPLCEGWSINHAIAAGDVLLAGGGNAFHGAGIWRSDDGGAHWDLVKLADGEMDAWIRSDPDVAASFGRAPAPPAPFTDRIEAIWSLGQAGARLFAGAKPATLFSSDDGGRSWAAVDSLTDHPSAQDWQPGAAGLTLHTIVSAPDAPERLWLGISAAGVFASEDGGASWERRNRLSNAEHCAPSDHPAAPSGGETGHCVHNMVRAAGSADVLYQQNHHGVYRSQDGGRAWEDITTGLPSTFGFPIAVHPEEPQTIWTLPLNGDSAGRYPPDAAAAVWRSRDGGQTWESCRNGLPQENCYFTVLRQAMTVDRRASLFFGTNTGSIFASADNGTTWHELVQHLPTVLCVEAA